MRQDAALHNVRTGWLAPHLLQCACSHHAILGTYTGTIGTCNSHCSSPCCRSSQTVR